MKFERNMNFSAEEFSDGEVLLYDDVSEVYHQQKKCGYTFGNIS